jgi:hypothetical protein
MELLSPKETTILDGVGKERTFFLGKWPAFDGLEIISRLPGNIATLAVPKVSDYATVKELQLKIMKYVAVSLNGRLQPLSTQALIDNHAGDWKGLGRLLIAEVEYNNGFFPHETISGFFAEAFRTALAKLSETLTTSSAQSSEKSSPLSTT